MVYAELLHACRAGDLETVESLLSTPNLDINYTDEWDYSALILASLCGHYPIVELLLKRGAICDRDSFEGERCIYGALNDKIRDLLLSYDISKTIDTNQPFANHISNLLAEFEDKFISKDIHIVSKDGKKVALHRFLLAARSPKLSKMVREEWYDVSEGKLEIESETLDFITNYIYLKTDKLSDIQDQPALIKAVELLELESLKSGILALQDAEDDKKRAKILHDNSFRFVELSRQEIKHFLQQMIDARLEVPLDVEDGTEFDEIDPESYVTAEMKSQLFYSDCMPDIILLVIDIATEKLVLYPCHKAMLMRSEYFETMFNSQIFLENHKVSIVNGIVDRNGSCDLPVISITCDDPAIAELVLQYLYHDNVDYIPMSQTVDLVYIADELLLDKLKSLCAVNVTSKFLDFSWKSVEEVGQRLGHDVFDLLRASWAGRCDKLEQFATRMISHNLERIYAVPHLRKRLMDLVVESSARIENRQATDTIELVDDIRYYLSKKYGVSDDLMKDFIPVGPSLTGHFDEDTRIRKESLALYDKDLSMIDEMLERLDLDA